MSTMTDPDLLRAREPEVGALLRTAWQRLIGELFDGLAAAGYDDLRVVHRPLLRHPPLDGLRPSELADQLHLSKQSINDLLRDMERMGYVHLEVDAHDGRARIIRFTDRGWRLFETGSALSKSVGDRWAQAIGRDAFDAMVTALRQIVALGEQSAGG
jgi:DNA-binding MarR family transcriptional regulator